MIENKVYPKVEVRSVERKNNRPLAWLERWVQILGMRNAEFDVYTEVHKNSSTANDNKDAPDIESCKRSIGIRRQYDAAHQPLQSKKA